MKARKGRGSSDVLVVCTGNLCRSPIMHVVLQAARPDLVVQSAGTAADGGDSWHELALEALRVRGYPASAASPHSTRRLNRADIASARLVLTAEGQHRSSVIRFDASAENRTFTLLEAARLSNGARPSTPESADEVVERLHTALYTQRSEGRDDLADPLNGELDAFLACVDQVQAAIESIFGSTTN